MYQTIRYDVSDGIATVTLNRPEQLNSFTIPMMRELLDVFDRIGRRRRRAGSHRHRRGRAFCAGADLSSGGDTFSRGGSDEQTEVGVPRDGGGMVTLRIFDCTKPVIGAINGAAVGVGVTMTLPMDIRLASEHAKFGFVFARRGIVPEACSSWFLPRLVGISQAAEWCYSGRVFPAAEALAGGWCAACTPPTICCPRPGDRRGDRRAHRAGQRGAHPADAVADARRVAPDGSAPRGLAGHPRAWPQRRRQGGRQQLPREATGALPDEGQRRAADIFPSYESPTFS